jgi:hypothetical protein
MTKPKCNSGHKRSKDISSLSFFLLEAEEKEFFPCL